MRHAYFWATMAKLIKIAVLVIYVLGAHALPLTHQHNDGVAHPKVASSSIVSGKCGCDSECSFKAFSVRPTAANTESCRLLTDDSEPSHSCGDACAICIAQTSPSGLAMTALTGLFVHRHVLEGKSEQKLLLINADGYLPGQRGPPAKIGLSFSLLA